VVLGAAAEEARALVPAGAEVVVATDWAMGLSASLRTGLAAAADAEAVVVVPVDTPDLPASAIRRILEAGGSPDALVQAVYDGRPGHPVLIGATHFAPLAVDLAGDVGARSYLVAHGVREVECADLWTGADIDAARTSERDA
jgi:CTP:molybdopterin cytidylyltransferase MocA